jgi:hypothetical protein
MTPDPATNWCAGRARHNDPSSCCPRRSNCAHWRALIDWGIAHQGTPVPAEVRVDTKLCKTGQYECHRPREAAP